MSSSRLSPEDIEISSSPPIIRKKRPASLTYSSPRLPPRQFTLLAPSLRQSPQIDPPTSPIAASEGFEAQLLLARNISDDSKEDVDGQVGGLLEQEKNQVFLT